MDYRRADDELFGKYCYIDTPWIAGEKTIYRIVRSGVRSNAWCDVPVKFKDETVTHDHREDIVFAVLDTLIDENTKIKRFALKDVEIITADRKTEPQTEICLYCEHYEPKGYCKLKECSVSPNHKCGEYLVIEPYEVKIISKSYESPNNLKAVIKECDIVECDYHKYCKERGQTDCAYKIKTEPQTDGYMTAEQTEDYRKMLDKAEHKVYGNIEDEPQTERSE